MKNEARSKYMTSIGSTLNTMRSLNFEQEFVFSYSAEKNIITMLYLILLKMLKNAEICTIFTSVLISDILKQIKKKNNKKILMYNSNILD